MVSRDEKEERDQNDSEPERLLYDDKCEGTPHVRILHFNDVYHPGEGEDEPKGGAARFKSLCDYYRIDDKFSHCPRPLTLFSGDAFNPSKESTVTKGSHMIPVLNGIGVDAACVGNHEFDFGAAHFAYLAKDCNFPWLLANIDDPELGEKGPMGKCERSTILETSNGIKVGIIGLVEKEWTEKINNSLPADLEYYEMLDVAQEIAPQLREQGADMVIALTHARQERDFNFCENLPEGVIDIALAAHDHWVEHHRFDNGVHLVRSGFDFKNLTYAEAYRVPESKRWNFKIVRRNINSDIKEDESMKQLGEELVKTIHRKLETQVGFTAAPLEARKEQCRTAESNYGNFLADLMRLYYDADCALINGGTFFGDRVYEPGTLYLKDIVNCFPFEDPIVVMRITGKALKEALENGVSDYPEPSPNFPQVSHITFTFDPSGNPGDRVRKVVACGKPLDMERKYSIATRSHMASGKVGYESLKGTKDGGTAEEIMDDENGILVSGLVRQYFSSIEMIQSFEKLSGSPGHKQAVLEGIGRHSARYDNHEDKQKMIGKKCVRKWRRVIGQKVDREAAMLDGAGEFSPGWSRGIAPLLEGRITAV